MIVSGIDQAVDDVFGCFFGVAYEKYARVFLDGVEISVCSEEIRVHRV